MICAAWKWKHETQVNSVAVKEAPNDYGVVCMLHSVLSSADAIVHHNGDRFDLKKLNARVIQYGLPPIKNLVQIDTLKIARKHFGFTSNRLDYLGEYLGCGRKINTPKGLWKAATEGDKKAIKEMVAYNKQDVLLLEEVYKKLEPYATIKLNLNHFTKTVTGEPVRVCPRPNCGSPNIKKNGFDYSFNPPKQKVLCKDCGGHSRVNKNGWVQ